MDRVYCLKQEEGYSSVTTVVFQDDAMILDIEGAAETEDEGAILLTRHDWKNLKALAEAKGW